MHRLLARQIAKATDSTGQLDQDRLFELVSAAYQRFGEARARSRRSDMGGGADRQADDSPAALDRLARENRVMEAALAHMVQGVAIFDADKRLLVSNARYAEIYDLPPHLLRRGTHFSDLVAFRLSHDFYAGERPAEYRPDRIQDALDVRDSVHCFRDGRLIAVARRPMQNGGWVTTHEDITEREELHAELRKQHELVTKQQEELRLRNMQFHAAINNMTEGLCFFDGQQRLIISNDRFVEMYNLEPGSVYPGITLHEVIELRQKAGSFPAMTFEEYYAARNTVALSNAPSRTEVELTNGKIFEIHHRPMPDGGWVATHEDITLRRQAEAKIAHMAHHDVLTDLPNRALLMERLGQAMKRVQRGETVGLHLIDLDHFKAVNDTLGHPVGDKLLQLVGERLRGVVRGIDTVARTGGDEFAIAQMGLKQSGDAALLAERVIEALRAPYEIAGRQIVIGASVGIALAPADGESEDDLIRNADLALYRSKADGRCTYRFFEQGMDAGLQMRRALEADLRKGLIAGEFELHYQPIIRLPSGEITACEALPRWTHPQKGMIMPDIFIPLAEEAGLIVQLGEWVIREACRAATQWPDGIKVSVNLSLDQFRNSDLCSVVVGALASAGLAPERLELEITENVLLRSDDATLATFDRLHGIGVRIAIDDFGAGYSSLSYLQRFHFANLKIDPSFVRDVTDNATSRSIVRAIAAMASGLGMMSTAEGVESEEQKAILFAEGCSDMQGYLFSRPLPAAQLARLLKHGAAPEAGQDVRVQGERAAMNTVLRLLP
jgi:diguanylate cyclase (GGDEF)-like protein